MFVGNTEKAKRRLPPIAPALLLDLEKRLAAPEFYGVPIGSTLGAFCYTRLFMAKGNFGTKEIVQCAAHYFYRRFFFRGLSMCQPKAKSVPILSTWMDDQYRFNDLIFPVWRALGESMGSVITGRRRMKAANFPGMEVISIADCYFDRAKWQKEYNTCMPIWRNILIQWLKDHQLSYRLAPSLLFLMLVQSQLVIQFDWLLRMRPPKVILTEYDRYGFTSVLVLLAKSMHIPTVTLVHSMVSTSYGFYPVLADKVCCWSTDQYNIFCSLGTPKEKLEITGCSRLTRTLPVKSKELCAKLDVTEDAKVILLASSAIGAADRRKFARVFSEAIRKIPASYHVKGVIRLHPSEDSEFYQTERADYPNVRYLTNVDLSLDDTLSLADLVVSHNSGLGGDALAKRRPVIILDVLEYPLSSGRKLAEDFGCPCVHSADELSLILTKALTDSRFMNSLLDGSDVFAKQFCFAYGDEATKNVVNVIRKFISIR